MKSKNRNHELPPLKPGDMLDDDEPFAAAPEPPPPRDVFLCPACGWGTPDVTHGYADPKRLRKCLKCGCGTLEWIPPLWLVKQTAVARLAKERAEREVAGKCPPCPSRTT